MLYGNPSAAPKKDVRNTQDCPLSVVSAGEGEWAAGDVLADGMRSRDAL